MDDQSHHNDIRAETSCWSCSKVNGFTDPSRISRERLRKSSISLALNVSSASRLSKSFFARNERSVLGRLRRSCMISATAAISVILARIGPLSSHFFAGTPCASPPATPVRKPPRAFPRERPSCFSIMTASIQDQASRERHPAQFPSSARPRHHRSVVAPYTSVV